MDPEVFVLAMFNGPVKKLNVFSATYLVKTPTRTLMGSMNGSTMKSAVKDLIFIPLKKFRPSPTGLRLSIQPPNKQFLLTLWFNQSKCES